MRRTTDGWGPRRVRSGGMTKKSVAIALTLSSALAFTGCTAATTEKDGASKITYKVAGTKKASLTYTDGGTKTSQETEANIPWTKTIKSKGDAIVYQISAQNSGPQSKRVKCTIAVDGKVVDRNVGKGQFAIASCEYTPK